MLDEATYGKSANVIEDWDDPDRIVLYRSILGVPIYCFPHVNEEMKAAYRRYQAKSEKGWPLHIDFSFEGVNDLDPEDAKRAKAAEAERLRVGLTAIALGAARGTVTSEDGIFALELDGGQSVRLAASLTDAAARLLHLEDDKPAVYDLAVAPLVADARKVGEDKALGAEASAAAAAWKKRCVALELMDSRDAAEEREYQALREATKLLG